MSIYNTEINDIQGKPLDWSKFEGKVLLVFNTASKCALTPQLEGLEELYLTYKDDGFEVLGTPCNQFMGQEPGSNEEVATFCQKNYGVSFTLSEKIKVNGKHTHPLYKILKSEGGGILSRIKWNFTKFLVGTDGHVFKRYAPTTSPSEIQKDIDKLLEQVPA